MIMRITFLRSEEVGELLSFQLFLGSLWPRVLVPVRVLFIDKRKKQIQIISIWYEYLIPYNFELFLESFGIRNFNCWLKIVLPDEFV